MIFDNSLDMINEALDLIPKGTQTMSKCYEQWHFGSAPIFCNKAKGPFIWDIDGNKFIDYMMSLGPIILGYNHSRTNKAIKRQLKRGIVFSLSNPLEIKLARLMREISPCAEMVRFGKNGSDVTSTAIRIARSYSGKELVLSPESHYHGWQDSFAASSSRNYGLPKCMHDLIHRFRYNDLEDLERYLSTKKYAAVIMEPVALDMPDKNYLQGVRSLCNKYDTILIFDEMVTGFRWSLGGAQEYFGVTADIATYGKAVANGMPISILAGKKKYMKQLDKVFYSGTNQGETLSIAVAIETINELKERRNEIYPHIWEQGNRLRLCFNNYCKTIGLNASMFGTGPRHNIRFDVEHPVEAKKLFYQEMIGQGIFMGSQIYVTAAHKVKHIDRTIKAIKHSLDIVKYAVSNNCINEELI